MSVGWQPYPPPSTWPEECDATATTTSTSELAVQSMGHGHSAELVQGGVAHAKGIQRVLVHVNQFLEKIQSVSPRHA